MKSKCREAEIRLLASAASHIALLVLLCGLSAQVTDLRAQGAAFTYQGRLDDGGAPANGIYDLQFTIYDSTNEPGTVIAGPLTNSATPVTNGLITVTLNFGAGVFLGTDRWLDIGVRPNGGGAFAPLRPRQLLTPTPYAMFAPNAGSATAVSGPVSASQITGPLAAANIGAGTITSSSLAPGAAAANLATGGQAGVASGGLVLSAVEDSALVGAGYVKIGTTCLNDCWQQRLNGTTPAARADHTAVWTGSEMIIWGGLGAGPMNDGGRYNPAANTWTALPTIAAPAARYYHTAIWTGKEMIVWGGQDASGRRNDGGRYDPAANAWTAVATDGAPVARLWHTAVWTGTEMVVWGGEDSSLFYGNGGRYDPKANRWTAIPDTLPNTPAARRSHVAVWTGSEMIVWGGYDFSYLNDGGRYNPVANSWTALPSGLPNTPTPRAGPVAAWTGNEMIVWGGNQGADLGDGGRYNPAANSWTSIPSSLPNSPGARSAHAGVWTGAELIIWGGYNGNRLNTGARFNPATGTWTTLPNAGASSGRSDHTAVWSGSEMLVWGGISDSFHGGSFYDNDGWRYNPASNSWTVLGSTPVPTVRSGHTAVWTGSEMIVWGGNNGSADLADGGRYNPIVNTWTPILASLGNTPAARSGHTAVWTGNKMLVWGGDNFNDGGLYDPAANSWTAIPNSLPNTPAARSGYVAIWTGSKLIVWGGANNNTYYADGGLYDPHGNSWTPILSNLANTPSARAGCNAVWTGSEMILWGGFNGSILFGVYYNDGGRYDPTANSWASIANNLPNTPGERSGHMALWTGNEMVIWGGYGSGASNDGGRYNPAANSWTAIPNSLPNTPSVRGGYSAVWTGSEIILWGGAYNTAFYANGARYNPAANTWTAVMANPATLAVAFHTAVWTGSEMLVWGGVNGSTYLNDNWDFTPGKTMFLYQKP